jgi:hypothetical protein
MRFAYSIQQKVKIAVLLFFIMTCSILIRILEDKSVKNMNESFISLYNDRLVPAMDLYHIVENLYARRNIIESVLYTNVQAHQLDLRGNLARYNRNIDSLVNKYEKTYLVQQEKVQLQDLKKNLKSIMTMEQRLVNHVYNNQSAVALNDYERQGKAMFSNATNYLTKLIDTQKQVGNEIITDTERIVSGSKIYSNLQLALAILIGILIVGILFTSNVVNIRNDKFNLN